MNFKQFIKHLLPTLWIDYQRKVRYFFYRPKSKFQGKGLKEIFTEIYRSNYWNGYAGLSGTGSVLEQTQVIKDAIQDILKEVSAKTLLDIPCGDFNWMKEVDLSNIDYIGGDIVEDLIEKNQEKFGVGNRRFEVIDLTHDTLPKADLILCRDCLVHFSFFNIFQAIEKIKSSGSEYLLTTTFTDRNINFDIITGDWRTLNLCKPPFNFPSPIKIINEQCTEGGRDYVDKSLGLWRIKDLPSFATNLDI